MNEIISKRQELLVLLKNNPLTTNEIAEELEIPVDHIRTYISQFEQIKKVGKKGRYNLYGIVEDNSEEPLELLKQLYEFMGNYMVIRKDKREEVKQNRELIAKIKELIV